MEGMQLFKAFVLGVVEGLTEFLPISSTGHLILVGHWIEFSSTEGRVFEVVIQLGAVLAVCWLYREKIVRLCRGVLARSPDETRLALAIAVAFLPAAAVGAILIGPIKMHLFDPLVVAFALILGGVVILMVERRRVVPTARATQDITLKHALVVGIAQCFAMIPGTSRSGATIVGGLLSGMSRQTATEFSFFLAIPTMLGAALYDGWRHHHLLTPDDTAAIAVGFAASFISALLVVRALVRFVATHSFRVFAYYRICFGALLLVWFGLAR